jgi:hypothetical protein
VLLPVYAAIAAAIVFYLLIPIAGAFALRGQWRRFRLRIGRLGIVPRLRYRDLAQAESEGRTQVGRFRLQGTIEAIEGADKVWVRGRGVSALVDLSRAPLYVLAPAEVDASAEPGTIERLKWRSVSSLVEGTNILVAGILVLEAGRPVFVDDPDEALVAVCHDGGKERLVSRLIAGGRAPNEYWNYLTRISMALGLVASSGILLLFRTSIFSTLRSLMFLAGLSPVLPFAPPGLAFFLLYRKFWRRALASRTARDLLRLPLHYSEGSGTEEYLRRTLARDEPPPEGATRIRLPGSGGNEPPQALTLFSPANTEDPLAETFVIEGDPEAQARRAERDAFFFAAASGFSLGLAVIVNFALAFLLWRAAL